MTSSSKIIRQIILQKQILMLLDWLDPFLTLEEQDRLLGWHLRVSL